MSYWREYVSIAPFFVLFIAFGAIPLVYALYLVTQKWDGLGESVFVGVDQIVRLAQSMDFWQALSNTILIFIMGQIPVVIGALIAAAMLSQPKLRFRSFYQTAFFLPQVTSLVVVAIVFQTLFSNNYGVINSLLNAVGLGEVDWLSNEWGMKLVIALMIIWRGFGYFLVIFMAGMASIDTSVYEAARVDGAGPVRIFRSVTIPLLIPTIIFVALTGTISGLQVFTEPQVLFNGTGGPNNGALTLMLMQYQYLGGPGTQSQHQTDLGFASAIGWAVFLLVVIIGAANSRGLLRSFSGKDKGHDSH